MAPVLYSSVAPLKKRGSAASSIMTKSSSSSVTPTSMYSFTRLYFACSRAHWLPTFLHRDHVGWCVVSFSLSILKRRVTTQNGSRGELKGTQIVTGKMIKWDVRVRRGLRQQEDQRTEEKGRKEWSLSWSGNYIMKEEIDCSSTK